MLKRQILAVLAVLATTAVGAMLAGCGSNQTQAAPDIQGEVTAAAAAQGFVTSAGVEVGSSNTNATLYQWIKDVRVGIPARKIDGAWHFGCLTTEGGLVAFDESTLDGEKVRTYFQTYGRCQSPFRRGDPVPPPPPVVPPVAPSA